MSGDADRTSDPSMGEIASEAIVVHMDMLLSRGRRAEAADNPTADGDGRVTSNRPYPNTTRRGLIRAVVLCNSPMSWCLVGSQTEQDIDGMFTTSVQK